MYEWVVRRRVRRVFTALSAGDYASILPGLAPKVHHRFAGNHPLGGERHDRDSVRLWFERLFLLFPGLSFTVHRVDVSGWPWDVTAAVEWTARVTPAAGDPYLNVGAHVLRIRRGRVACIHAYEDSQAVANACEVMAGRGIAEAAAQPIIS